MERPVALGERSCRFGETGSGVAELIAQFLLPFGEVGEHLIVVAESPAQPRGGSPVGGCSSDESAQLTLEERSSRRQHG